MHYRALIPPLCIAIATCLVLAACTTTKSASNRATEQASEPLTDLELIKKRGELVLTTGLDGVGCYYLQDDLAGHECLLLSGFADRLGVTLSINKQPTVADMFHSLNQKQADVGAADLTQTEQREQHVRFSMPLFATREVLIQRSDQAIDSIAKLAGKTVSLRSNSVYVSELQRAANQVGLNIGPQATATTIGVEFVDEKRATLALIADVAEKEIDFTIADQHIAENANVDDNNLDSSLVFGRPRNIGLVVRKNGDGSLLKALNAWLNSEPAQAILQQVTQPQKATDAIADNEQATPTTPPSISPKTDASQIKLTPWDYLYQRHASPPFDWQWLAAQSYVESRFYPDAVSPAGAMGLMQLMPGTARELRVPETEFFDLNLNVRGAAMYNLRMYQHWKSKGLSPRNAMAFALASYNAGLGHVLDARTLARSDGANPDQWLSSDNQRGVEDYITELEHQAVYQRADIKYGYCRGSEPKNYVRKIFKQRQLYAEKTGNSMPFLPASQTQ